MRTPVLRAWSTPPDRCAAASAASAAVLGVLTSDCCPAPACGICTSTRSHLSPARIRNLKFIPRRVGAANPRVPAGCCVSALLPPTADCKCNLVSRTPLLIAGCSTHFETDSENPSPSHHACRCHRLPPAGPAVLPAARRRRCFARRALWRAQQHWLPLPIAPVPPAPRPCGTSPSRTCSIRACPFTVCCIWARQENEMASLRPAHIKPCKGADMTCRQAKRV